MLPLLITIASSAGAEMCRISATPNATSCASALLLSGTCEPLCRPPLVQSTRFVTCNANTFNCISPTAEPAAVVWGGGACDLAGSPVSCVEGVTLPAGALCSPYCSAGYVPAGGTALAVLYRCNGSALLALDAGDAPSVACVPAPAATTTPTPAAQLTAGPCGAFHATLPASATDGASVVVAIEKGYATAAAAEAKGFSGCELGSNSFPLVLVAVARPLALAAGDEYELTATATTVGIVATIAAPPATAGAACACLGQIPKTRVRVTSSNAGVVVALRPSVAGTTTSVGNVTLTISFRRRCALTLPAGATAAFSARDGSDANGTVAYGDSAVAACGAAGSTPVLCAGAALTLPACNATGACAAGGTTSPPTAGCPSASLALGATCSPVCPAGWYVEAYPGDDLACSTAGAALSSRRVCAKLCPTPNVTIVGPAAAPPTLCAEDVGTAPRARLVEGSVCTVRCPAGYAAAVAGAAGSGDVGARVSRFRRMPLGGVAFTVHTLVCGPGGVWIGAATCSPTCPPPPAGAVARCAEGVGAFVAGANCTVVCPVGMVAARATAACFAGLLTPPPACLPTPAPAPAPSPAPSPAAAPAPALVGSPAPAPVAGGSAAPTTAPVAAATPAPAAGASPAPVAVAGGRRGRVRVEFCLRGCTAPGLAAVAAAVAAYQLPGGATPFAGPGGVTARCLSACRRVAAADGTAVRQADPSVPTRVQVTVDGAVADTAAFAADAAAGAVPPVPPTAGVYQSTYDPATPTAETPTAAKPEQDPAASQVPPRIRAAGLVADNVCMPCPDLAACSGRPAGGIRFMCACGLACRLASDVPAAAAPPPAGPAPGGPSTLMAAIVAQESLNTDCAAAQRAVDAYQNATTLCLPFTSTNPACPRLLPSAPSCTASAPSTPPQGGGTAPPPPGQAVAPSPPGESTKGLWGLLGLLGLLFIPLAVLVAVIVLCCLAAKKSPPPTAPAPGGATYPPQPPAKGGYSSPPPAGGGPVPVVPRYILASEGEFPPAARGEFPPPATVSVGPRSSDATYVREIGGGGYGATPGAPQSSSYR